MKTIAEIVGRPIVSEKINSRTGSIVPYAPSGNPRTTEPDQFQEAVLNYLFLNKERLAIRDVFRCFNIRVDGAITLADTGTFLGVEVKYRMNWEKACQACSEIREWLQYPIVRERKPSGAIVVFGEFSGDWTRGAKDRKLENGWNYWYGQGELNAGGHSVVESLRVDLVRLHDDKLQDYPG